jgi:hypothetical protein
LTSHHAAVQASAASLDLNSTLAVGLPRKIEAARPPPKAMRKPWTKPSSWLA